MENDKGEVGVNDFDLAQRVDGGYITGYHAMVRGIRKDGQMFVRTINHNVDPYELVGLLQLALDLARNQNMTWLCAEAEFEEE